MRNDHENMKNSTRTEKKKQDLLMQTVWIQFGLVPDQYDGENSNQAGQSIMA